MVTITRGVRVKQVEVRVKQVTLAGGGCMLKHLSAHSGCGQDEG